MEKNGEIRHFKFKCRKKLPKHSHQGQRQGVGLHDWRNTFSVNKRGRNANTNYVDIDTESEHNSTPHYVFYVEDRLGQRSGIVIVVVEGVHGPNFLTDSGTCNRLGYGTWEWLKSQKIQCQTQKEAKALFRKYKTIANTRNNYSRHYVH